MKTFGLFRGRLVKKYRVVQEFDRSVFIDVHLCGISMGAVMAVGALEDWPVERANEVADRIVAHITDDPLMMETIRHHVMDHVKSAESHVIPGVRQ